MRLGQSPKPSSSGPWLCIGCSLLKLMVSLGDYCPNPAQKNSRETDQSGEQKTQNPAQFSAPAAMFFCPPQQVHPLTSWAQGFLCLCLSHTGVSGCKLGTLQPAAQWGRGFVCLYRVGLQQRETGSLVVKLLRTPSLGGSPPRHHLGLGSPPPGSSSRC